MRRSRWAWLLAACALPVVADDAVGELERMGRALRDASYHGELVFVRDGQLDALRVRHAGARSGGRDQIERLTGPELPLQRDAHGTRLGDGPAWLAEAAAIAAPVAGLAAQNYELQMVGEDRVAGRAVRVLDARPRDGARYARRYWIDRDSGLLLRSALFGADGIAVEQWMFAAVTVAPQAEVAAEPATAHPPARREFRGASQADVGAARTQVLDPPAGFALTAAAVTAQGEQLVFSDGLAQVSVFVERQDAAQAVLSGLQRRGALSVFGRLLDNAQIVVVGEVPPSTAERFAQGVARRAAP